MSETTEQQWTIKRLLEWTEDYFAKVDAGSPRLEAEILLAEALKCARIELYTRFDEIPEAAPISKFRDWVKRRATGEPVAYIVGYREFYSLRFEVDSNVLIPRPETEHVVVAALEAAKSFEDRPIRVIDVGTGSGCIAIALAKHLDDGIVAATDISSGALAIAHRNAVAHEVDERVRVLEGDLFEALPEGSGPVHLVVSNPPYVGTQEIETVDAQVREYEPEIALFSGEYGIETTARLIAESPDRLLEGGYLIFETSPIIVDQCRKLVGESASLDLIDVVRDLDGLDRVIVARKS